MSERKRKGEGARPHGPGVIYPDTGDRMISPTANGDDSTWLRRTTKYEAEMPPIAGLPPARATTADDGTDASGGRGGGLPWRSVGHSGRF